MGKERKQSFLQGALILMMGTMVVKVVSLLFKIPITNMLSEVAMSYFENAYNFFTLFSTLATAGFPVAISKIVAENTVQRRYKDTKKVLSLSRRLFLITGIVFTLMMFLGAGVFARFIRNPGAKISIMCLSPAVFFLCMMSAYRGYYQGLRDMYPTAVSQIMEAVVKLLCGVGFTAAALKITQTEYAQSGTVLGKAYDPAAAELAIQQIGAGAALLGVMMSTAAGFLYLALRHRFVGDGINRHHLAASVPPRESRDILHYLIRLAVPICLGSLALNMTSIIDMMTVMGQLTRVVDSAPDTVRALYGTAIPKDMADSLIPAHLYGAYTSIAVTISNIIPAVSTGFGVSALPLVSNAWAKRSYREVSHSVNMVLRITTLFCVPAGIGIMVLARPISELFFHNKPMGIAIAAPILSVLGLASIFTSLTLTLNSLLQAVGRVSVPVRLVVVGGIVKLILNFVLVGIPSVNLHAVPYSTLISYLVICVLSMYAIRQTTHVPVRLFAILWKPAIGGTVCAMTAVFAYDLLSMRWDTPLMVLPAICIGGAAYAISVILLGAVKKEDILMLPKGEKVVKILEKCSLMG